MKDEYSQLGTNNTLLVDFSNLMSKNEHYKVFMITSFNTKPYYFDASILGIYWFN